MAPISISKPMLGSRFPQQHNYLHTFHTPCWPVLTVVPVGTPTCLRGQKLPVVPVVLSTSLLALLKSLQLQGSSSFPLLLFPVQPCHFGQVLTWCSARGSWSPLLPLSHLFLSRHPLCLILLDMFNLPLSLLWTLPEVSG